MVFSTVQKCLENMTLSREFGLERDMNLEGRKPHKEEFIAYTVNLM